MAIAAVAVDMLRREVDAFALTVVTVVNAVVDEWLITVLVAVVQSDRLR